MDSISENVVAMIAVVVGILIIGTALVPIVQHASGTETTETVTGTNDYSGISGFELAAQITGTHILKLDGNGVTLDSDPLTGTVYLRNNYSVLSGDPSFIIEATTGGITVNLNGNVYLTEATATITPDQATIVGIRSGQDFEQTFSLTSAALCASTASYLSAIPSTEVYTAMFGCTIGDGQTLDLVYGSQDDPSTMTVTTATTAAAMPEAATLTNNSNGTVTVTISHEDGIIIGPIAWSQTVTTSEGSQYASLYGIIPIMCILAMAYVLIRRF